MLTPIKVVALSYRDRWARRRAVVKDFFYWLKLRRGDKDLDALGCLETRIGNRSRW